tara:strand:+ start:2064 stop:2435 length:372 start_codon:yes stop_codon:yes gene_type:complete
MPKTLVLAIDFDGCLVEFDYPRIGKQTAKQKKLMDLLKKLQKQGHKLVLWTSRGEPALEEAINWCHKQGLEFDSFQVNPFTKKTSGPSPKILADYYIDDKALSFGSNDERDKTLAFLEDLING